MSNIVYATCEIAGTSLMLLPEKALYWPDKKTLFVADVHMGKVMHFRKNGIPLPQQATKSNLDRLSLLLDSLDISSVYFLGDLFHSEHNEEWHELEQLVTRYPDSDFKLVEGNHDVLEANRYGSAGIQVLPEGVQLEPFVLYHIPPENTDGNDYVLCGHVHPAVELKGRGRQRLTLPCFHFGPRLGILPAFGVFTGNVPLKHTDEDQIFAIGANQIFKV